jgi:D-beta-D-heptose 7-phosphate kinase / D-beta-D-heptose 1-phosphate adenosyltransferase
MEDAGDEHGGKLPVIVATSDLGRHRGEVAMVDGGFDPLHAGHIAYFEAAAALGAPVLCNVSSDDWVGRKHPPLLDQDSRAAVIDAIRYVAYTHISSMPTVEVLRLLGPRYYVKGADWRGRLPDDELVVCADNGTEVVYLDTVVDSSTAILERYARRRAG